MQEHTLRKHVNWKLPRRVLTALDSLRVEEGLKSICIVLHGTRQDSDLVLLLQECEQGRFRNQVRGMVLPQHVSEHALLRPKDKRFGHPSQKRCHAYDMGLRGFVWRLRKLSASV